MFKGMRETEEEEEESESDGKKEWRREETMRSRKIGRT